MKLSATLKNNRGGQKVTADDTRILIDLKLGNRLIGTIGFYNIIDDKVEGYRVLLDNEVIREIVKGKQQTGNCYKCKIHHIEGGDCHK
jgi:hypothetical protein